MALAASQRAHLQVVSSLADESLYIGIDVGKHSHVAGFISSTLLGRHERFESCPVLTFEQSREGFRRLLDRIRSYVPIEQCHVILEKTGHYHHALEQYLLELDISVYVMHVRSRPVGMIKSDKRDALGLANHLYNQLELGVQGPDKLHVVRRAVPPTKAASQLKGFIRHRYELIHESTQRKNKLIALCDELFPEFTQVCKDPNLASALAIREKFPTPHAVATASMSALREVRVGRHPSDEKLLVLQQLARDTIGTKDIDRQRGLTFEQNQLIKELKMLQEHIEQLDSEITSIVEHCREGKILTSIPAIGPIQAATLIAAIGHIDNFSKASELKSYFGWAPTVTQSGVSLDQAHLTRAGTRTVKHTMFLIVGNAIQMDCEWAKIYERLVPIKCSYDERTHRYKGKVKVMGRIAGQMIKMMFALLKQDQETLRKVAPGSEPPEPTLYDASIHHSHRQGKYRPIKPMKQANTLVHLPKPNF